MDQNAESNHLRQLLNAFQVEPLGEGDTTLGLNLLATMASVLADLAPTNDTILTKAGRPLRLGVNLLITGPASTGLVEDEILTEIGLRQRNLWYYLQRYVRHIEQQRKEPGASLPPMDPTFVAPEDRVAETQHGLEPLLNTRSQSWGKILSETPVEDLAAVASRPKFLVSLGRPKDLPDQLRGLRPGHPLVHAGCVRPKDLFELAELGAALIQGHYPLGNGCETARGHFLITDPLQILREIAKEPEKGTAWLGHFLWVCDGKAGPQAPTDGRDTDRPEMITTRFQMVLDNVLARRMNVPGIEPILISLDTGNAKIRFREFLDDMEPRLPGISYAAKNLIDSLAFGLNRMAAIARTAPPSYDAIYPFSREPVEGLEAPLPLSVASIEALARFLVKRMVNARTVMIHAGALEQRQSQIRRIFRKLQQGSGENRNLYRSLSLSIADCEQGLRWLEQVGIAYQVNRKWELVEGAHLRFEDHATPLLDV